MTQRRQYTPRRPRDHESVQQASKTPEPAETAENTVVCRISTALLCQLMRLKADVTIRGARVDGDNVEFELHVPGAPDDAQELLISYRKRLGVPDPIDAHSSWKQATA